MLKASPETRTLTPEQVLTKRRADNLARTMRGADLPVETLDHLLTDELCVHRVALDDDGPLWEVVALTDGEVWLFTYDTPDAAPAQEVLDTEDDADVTALIEEIREAQLREIRDLLPDDTDN